MQQTQYRILIIDDDLTNLDALGKVLEREGFLVIKAGDVTTGMKFFQTETINLVITDLKMAGQDGFDVLRQVKQLNREIEVIVVTAHGTIEKAVAAIKEGAYDFITKPFDRMTIIQQVRKALEKQDLIRENRFLRRELEMMRSSKRIIGDSKVIRDLMHQIEQAATSDATVLVWGESGTGKELVAEALHRFSRRAEQVFVKVSCTTIPDNLLEAELFGYEKGAFTGAVQRKEGRFELADRGTIFLDEIGELPLNLQSKLLRILQEGAFERLGSNKTQRVNVRVVAATNRDLRLEVKEQRFREDLFFRLQVIELKLPPLRARQEDIPLLIEHFIKLYSAKNNKFVHGIADDALQELQKQPWPGNIRQLENAIERAIIFAKGEVIQKNDLPNLYNEELTKSGSITIPLGTSMSDIEKVVIEETLRLTGGDKNKAAALLGIAARTIYRKIDP